MISAVIFDLDGVLLDSEGLWDQARREVTADVGGHWRPEATEAMQGMSSPEWARYMADALAIALPPGEINELVVRKMLALYERELPLLPGATAAVQRMHQRWPLGLASSSNRVILDTVLRLSGLRDAFGAVVSSEEVPKGKPAPDVYLAAAQQLSVPPGRCCAVEDSTNGILSAVNAGMAVVAVPNAQFPPKSAALSRAAVVCEELTALTVDLVAGLPVG